MIVRATTKGTMKRKVKRMAVSFSAVHCPAPRSFPSIIAQVRRDFAARLRFPVPLTRTVDATGKVHLLRKKEPRGHPLYTQDAHQRLQPLRDDAQIAPGEFLETLEKQPLRDGGRPRGD